MVKWTIYRKKVLKMNSILNLHIILEQVLNEAAAQAEVENAIKNRKAVMMTYNDESGNPHEGKRWTEPYALVSFKDGSLGLRAYQYNGDTKRGKPHWKLFKLDRITSFTPTNSKFTIDREGYNKLGDKQYPVICQVVDDAESLNVSQNLEKQYQDNVKSNIDTFGRYIDKNITKQQQPQSGPVQNTASTAVMQSTNIPQSGPVIDKSARQKDWKRYTDLNYRRNKREQEKAEKLRKQAFGDEEDEMMSDFDNKPLFNNI